MSRGNLVVNPTSLTIGEAGSDTFTVKLATEPSSNVTVTVSSDETGAATVSPASLTFTTSNWNTNQTVTVSGVNDTDTADESLTVSLSATAGGYGGKTSTVSVSVTDDDDGVIPNVSLSETALSVTEGDAAGDSYTVVLDSMPTADVVVDGGRALGHGRDPDPNHPDFHHVELGHRPDGDGYRRGRCGHGERYGHADPQRGEH